MRPATGIILLLLAAGATRSVHAQAGEADRRAVLAVLHRLFDGMRTGDSAAVRAAFHPSAYLATALEGRDGPILRVDTLETFVHAVGTPHDEAWDERLSGEEVRIDGPLASVWTEYSFFVGGRFSHCGVDAFQLALTTAGWQIIALTDTRRQTGCREKGGR
jgi:hypothetical protein